MTVEITILVAFIIILGLLFYTKTKKFREARERTLIHSFAFQDLTRLGFKTKRVDNKILYYGKFKNYDFAVFIDSDDVMAQNNFSLVFSVSYAKIREETFKYLNQEYYNRLKSLVMNSENIFFDWEFAQFRYTNSPLKISTSKINSKLNLITEILKKEKLKPNEMTNIRRIISRGYE